MATSTDDELQTYRTMPARVTGWVLTIGVLVLGVVIGVMEANLGNNPFSPTAYMLVVVAVVWLVLLRPCVRVGTDRVELRNLVTDVEVPYSRLAAVEHQWALEAIDNAGVKHSSWAIPVRREMRPRKDIDSYAESTTRGHGREGNNAEVITGRVAQAQQRWKLAGGHDEPGEGAHRTWAWSAFVPLVVALVLAVIVTLVA